MFDRWNEMLHAKSISGMNKWKRFSPTSFNADVLYSGNRQVRRPTIECRVAIVPRAEADFWNSSKALSTRCSLSRTLSHAARGKSSTARGRAEEDASACRFREKADLSLTWQCLRSFVFPPLGFYLYMAQLTYTRTYVSSRLQQQEVFTFELKILSPRDGANCLDATARVLPFYLHTQPNTLCKLTLSHAQDTKAHIVWQIDWDCFFCFCFRRAKLYDVLLFAF